MLTYKNLYCSLVRSMSEAIDLYDEGKGILAREGLKKALLDVQQGFFQAFAGENALSLVVEVDGFAHTANQGAIKVFVGQHNHILL